MLAKNVQNKDFCSATPQFNRALNPVQINLSLITLLVLVEAQLIYILVFSEGMF